MAERKFKTVDTGKFVILGGERDDGDPIMQVEGTLIQKDQVAMRGSDVGRYQLQDDNGETLTFLGATTLDEKLNSIEVGSYIRVTLNEATIRTSSGNQMKDFTVEVAE